MVKSKTRLKKKPDNALRRLRKIAKSFKEPGSVKVGLPKGSNDYPDGTSVIMVGLVHEFGSPSKGIPERSFLRSTVAEEKRSIKRMMAKMAKQILDGKLDADKALQLLGLKVQTDVKAKITDLKEPALKSRDGNPLIDTGHLRQSIIFQVTE
jgi:phage gpG-like protein